MKLQVSKSFARGRLLQYNVAICLLMITSACLVLQFFLLAHLQMIPMISSPQLRLLSTSISSKFSFVRGIKEKEEVPMAVIAIPHILWFTYETNILLSKEPNIFYQNVMHTIDAYNQTWGTGVPKKENINNELQVRFLDDPECLKLVQEAYPELSTYFAQETNGAFRGDICRVAALYLNGGYYFDVDMEVIEPYVVQDRKVHSSNIIIHHDEMSNLSVVEPSIFVSVLNADRNRIFQSFIASTAYNPILRKSFSFMMDYYEDRNANCTRMNDCLMGTATMLQAYEQDVQERQQQQQQHEEQKQNNIGINNKNTAGERDNNIIEESLDKTGVSNDNTNNGTATDFDRAITLFGSFLLYEDKLTPELYPDFPRRPGVDNFYCNYIVHDPTEEIVYFYSRIVGSKNCPYLGDEPPPSLQEQDLGMVLPFVPPLVQQQGRVRFEQFLQRLNATIEDIPALEE